MSDTEIICRSWISINITADIHLPWVTLVTDPERSFTLQTSAETQPRPTAHHEDSCHIAHVHPE